MKLNVQRHLKMLAVAFGESTMSRTQVQLWYNRFKEGREDVNDIEAVKKMISNNRRITIRERLLMMLEYRSAHTKQFYRCFRHETHGSEDFFKIAKLLAKTTSS